MSAKEKKKKYPVDVLLGRGFSHWFLPSEFLLGKRVEVSMAGGMLLVLFALTQSQKSSQAYWRSGSKVVPGPETSALEAAGTMTRWGTDGV